MRTMGIMMDFQYLKDCRNGWKPLMEEGRWREQKRQKGFA